MQYYEINEQTARRANDVNSMSDYRPGSATEEYRAAVDKAAALVQARKAKISPYYHDKLDALLDRYARRLADYYNAYYRNESACPSILVCGGSNFPVRKKQKQNARRESLWQEYKEIDAILDKIRSVGTGAVDLTDPHARELLQDRLPPKCTQSAHFPFLPGDRPAVPPRSCGYAKSAAAPVWQRSGRNNAV